MPALDNFRGKKKIPKKVHKSEEKWLKKKREKRRDYRDPLRIKKGKGQRVRMKRIVEKDENTRNSHKLSILSDSFFPPTLFHLPTKKPFSPLFPKHGTCSLPSQSPLVAWDRSPSFFNPRPCVPRRRVSGSRQRPPYPHLFHLTIPENLFPFTLMLFLWLPTSVFLRIAGNFSNDSLRNEILLSRGINSR